MCHLTNKENLLKEIDNDPDVYVNRRAFIVNVSLKEEMSKKET